MANQAQFNRLQTPDVSAGEFYCEAVASWFKQPEPSDGPVRMKLRHGRLNDKVREQGLIDPYFRHLPRALNDITDGGEH